MPWRFKPGRVTNILENPDKIVFDRKTKGYLIWKYAGDLKSKTKAGYQPNMLNYESYDQGYKAWIAPNILGRKKSLMDTNSKCPEENNFRKSQVLL